MWIKMKLFQAQILHLNLGWTETTSVNSLKVPIRFICFYRCIPLIDPIVQSWRNAFLHDWYTYAMWYNRVPEVQAQLSPVKIDLYLGHFPQDNRSKYWLVMAWGKGYWLVQGLRLTTSFWRSAISHCRSASSMMSSSRKQVVCGSSFIFIVLG